MEHLRRVPVEGDTLTWHSFKIEVADMDRVRIDKVAVLRLNDSSFIN